MTIAEAARAVVDPEAYAEGGRLHEACAVLRRDSPVHWVDGRPDYNPFWVVTRRADIIEVEQADDVFRNYPRSVLVRAEEDARQAEQGQLVRTLVHMDGAEHRVMRTIAADWFRPGAVRALQASVERLAREYVDRLSGREECDFAADVAVHYPLSVILSLLGLPEADFPRMLTLTQELFGAVDPERRRGQTIEEQMATVMDFFAYFQGVIAQFRQTPTGDLGSAIANARIDGEYLSDLDAVSYCILIATAGHDTTSSAISGGLLALLRHPEQLARLRAEPDLLPGAVEEMIRWTTPVKAFMRTAAEDRPLGGVTVRRGEQVLLLYPSANHDEAEFERPFEFDVTRTPNRHLAFGAGVHFCLGAQLARMEIQAFFAELLPRLEHAEVAGPVRGVASTFVSGLKRLPLRYRLAHR
ncbi:cytochrome P450 [Dactylosporangium sp. NPDC051541]|uniref:cytochrome P450 n=1 Tax=Dactylosporangium sp. NPDC051541 TaxID=3363977 RepID=UPI00379331AF